DSSFGVPSALTIDPFGNFFYADLKNNNIHKLDKGGKEISLFGSEGAGRGQFRSIRSLSFDEKQNRLFIVDSDNARVQLFRIETGEGQSPLAPAAPRRRIVIENSFKYQAEDVGNDKDGNLYFLQRKEGNVIIADKKGKPVGGFGKDPKGKTLLGEPQSIIVTEKERIYISDSSSHRIHVLDLKGEKLFDFGGKGSGDGNFRSPRGIASLNGYVVVADSGNNRVQILNEDGIFLRSFGKSGKSSGEFDGPLDVATNSRKEIFVVDSENHRIQVFNMEGKFIRAFGKEGLIRGRFYEPRSISIDADDKVYILDGKKGERIQVFDAEGKFLYSFGSFGEKRPDFNEASNISVDSSRGVRVFIADRGNKMVKVLKLKQVPESPVISTIKSNEKESLIQWEGGKTSFTAGYRIYARGLKEEAFSLIGDTRETSFSVDAAKSRATPVFALSAYSLSGLESPLSTEAIDFFQNAYDYYIKGDFPEAARLFEKLLSENPEHAKGLIYAGESYADMGEYENARKKYKALSKIEGFANEGALRLGGLHLHAKEYDTAETVFKRILEDSPADVKAKRYLGEVYYHKGLYTPAIEMLKDALDSDPEDGKAYEILGHIYLKSKVLNKAEEAFKGATKSGRGTASAYRGLALLYEKKGDSSKAIENLKKAISLSPKDIETYIHLSELYLHEGNIKEAEKIVNAALLVAPGSADANYLSGRLMVSSKRFEDAVIAFRNALMFDKTHESAQFHMAKTYIEIGQPDDAVIYLKKLVAQKSENAEVYFALGKLERGKDSGKEKIKLFTSCVEALPDEPRCRTELATLYMEMGKPDEASKHLEELVRISPQDAEAQVELASALKALGKTGEAMVHLETAIGIDEKNSAARHLLGTIYMENKELSKALTELQKAVAYRPASATFQNSLGLVYLDMSRPDDAISAFKKAFSLKAEDGYKANLNKAYEKKKLLLASSSEAPPVEISEVSFGNIFASAYKSYETDPIGNIIIKNNSEDILRNLKISLNIKKYMDFPSEHIVKSLKPHENVTVQITSTFNNALLEITEDTPVQAEITVDYYRAKKKASIVRRESVKLYNRNAMTWSRKDMAAAFVTPKDAPVVDFARGVIQMLRSKTQAVDENMGKAIRIFDALGALGVLYVVDPNNPYTSVSTKADIIDSIQYPRHTLKHKTGDCDDLVVLYSSLLENIGVETVMLDIPGHLFMAFKSATPAEDGNKISTKKDLYIVRDGFVWIPVEATMVGKSFTEAWYEGAKEVRLRNEKKELKIIDTRKAWAHFKPVSIEEPQPVELPEKEKFLALIQKDLKLQRRKGIEKLTSSYLKALEKDPENRSARMNLGITYGKNGYYDEALKEFAKILEGKPDDADALNNTGNIFFEIGDFKAALENYKKAEKNMGSDPVIKINLALAFYRLDNPVAAKKMFKEAETLSSDVVEKFSSLRSILFD
ncbi:MAG: tetratricopeptide repeat protein, partial [bacterium]|nr:tetratricopeptide repeat protein [bacterium]